GVPAAGQVRQILIGPCRLRTRRGYYGFVSAATRATVLASRWHIQSPRAGKQKQWNTEHECAIASRHKTLAKIDIAEIITGYTAYDCSRIGVFIRRNQGGHQQSRTWGGW